MKILFVTNQIPFPPDNGVRIPTHHAMRLMHQKNHELALAVLSDEKDIDGLSLTHRLQEIGKTCKSGMYSLTHLPSRNRLLTLISSTTTYFLYFIARYHHAPFRKKLQETIETFAPDVIHFDIITLSQYEDLSPKGVGKIASINDSYALTLKNALEAGNYSGLELIYRKSQLFFTKLYESKIYQKFNCVHVMTDVDAKYLRQLNPNINCHAIANGVAPELFSIAKQTKNKRDVIFVGNLVAENVIYLERLLKETWPVVSAAEPNAKLHIIGRVSDEARHLANQFDGRNGVIFRGYINSLADAYRDCGIALTPVNKDCGILNKAIEAMAAGMAVIGFNKSFAGIKDGFVNEHYLTTDNYISMGHMVVKLLRDPTMQSMIQEKAHILAQKNYSWENRADSLEDMYTQAMNQARGELKAHAARQQ